MAGLTTWTPDGHGREESCPVLDNPEPDCYCLNMTSLTIPKAVQFCLRDFRQCPIYKRYMGMPENGTEEMCPVLDDPKPDCYCLNMTSMTILKAVQFCLRDFRQCPIYKRYMGMPET
jgi:hypothetical protein